MDPAAVLVETSASSNLEGLTDIPSSAERPSIENVITQLKSSQDPNHQYKKQIVYERIFDKREACWGVFFLIITPTQVTKSNTVGKLKRPLLEHITNALKMARGVTGFYSHQAAAINSIWAGNNVIVSTSTASGKSIIYQVQLYLHRPNIWINLPALPTGSHSVRTRTEQGCHCNAYIPD